MKRITGLLIAALILLAGCSAETARWYYGGEQGDGIGIALTDTDDGATFYANYDTVTGDILSVNLLYPASCGGYTSTRAESNGTVLSCEVTHGEREEGGALFIAFDKAAIAACGDRPVTLTVSFENAPETVVFRFPDIAAAVQNRTPKPEEK